MSFILVPNHGEDLQVNAWNWRPTIELLRAENLVGSDDLERLATQGCGGEVDGTLAVLIADVLGRRLAAMRPGQRMRLDLTVTGDTKREVNFSAANQQTDAIDLYSATYEWLVSFRDFCKESGGFQVL